MGYNLEDACNGCAECRGCRLTGSTRKVFYCDFCEKDFDTSELRQYKDEYICHDCFIEMMEDEWDELPKV